jgi:two-component system alkaline phosphatase synthesis response regulator PhoP
MPPKKILIVDDDEDIRTLVSELLEQEGFEVAAEVDGYACLRRLKTGTPDLLILDMMMPGMSGLQLCERIRMDKKLSKVRIMFLTVIRLSELENGKKLMKKLDIKGYVTKPFDSQSLVALVKKITTS